jgi:hypothetical protein
MEYKPDRNLNFFIDLRHDRVLFSLVFMALMGPSLEISSTPDLRPFLRWMLGITALVLIF